MAQRPPGTADYVRSAVPAIKPEKTTDKMMRKTIPFLLLALFACSKSGSDTGPDPGPTPGEVVTYGNESLVAIDPAGKEIAFDYRHKTLRDKKSASSTSSGWAPTATTPATISAATSSRRRPRTPGRPTTSANWKRGTAIRPTSPSVPEAPCTIGASTIWTTTFPTTHG